MWAPILAKPRPQWPRIHSCYENEPIRRRGKAQHNRAPEPNNLCYWNENEVNGRQAFRCVKYLSFKKLRQVTTEGETIKYSRLLEGSVNARKHLVNCWELWISQNVWTPYLISQASAFEFLATLFVLTQLCGFKPLDPFVIIYSFGICQQLYNETVLKQFASAGTLRNSSNFGELCCSCRTRALTLKHDILTAVSSSWSWIRLLLRKFIHWAISIWWRNGDSSVKIASKLRHKSTSKHSVVL